MKRDINMSKHLVLLTYTEQGPNNDKDKDVTLSHAHSAPVICHEISKAPIKWMDGPYDRLIS